MNSGENPQAADLDRLVQAAKGHLGGDWRIVSSSQKLRKILFEAEFNGRRVIGKMSLSARARTAYGNMEKLWNAGMRPPSRYTVAEPIAFLPDDHLLIQEKAPGQSIYQSLSQPQIEDAYHSACWLRRLWDVKVEAEVDDFNCKDIEDRMVALSAQIEDRRPLLLGRRVMEALSKAPTEWVLSHGDFHPMNIFVSKDRITVIDIDTFALRDKETDAGYFVAQTANMAFQQTGSFSSTAEFRSAFLEECGPLDMDRVSAYAACALLKSLHFDFCILRLQDASAEPYLRTAERILDARTLGPKL